ncbi:hypothetical protein [Fusobacterium necrophorum]|uniref:Uncharacterized protein n=2 Tax=Fusobacterium necrophorum TaxID=859 RepID=A0AAN3VX80_9FUSO|nr:hypothetical protein [Fusobacterium necrophorum]AYV94647.1 hypothetical protein BWX37_03010 [Fusobacterium necrophorum subsp. funduliforme]EJU18821.1 hypothetical protein HMPREF1127_1135 [Fusobacterium necrophorum subsp. funduliforme Fnf 1007]KYL03343.1 hypothetical protein A2J06_09420 [Fusobacterium necrophorum subsp. funduliforme]KYM40863.1 hypothetical protein A2U03_03525 [Fusobacterium necrophorum subsp. funduliforme]KYM50784.1 hypothetical protein A2U04_00105 [Fusobacterium necrophorum
MKDEDLGWKKIVKELEELQELRLIIYIDDKKTYEKTGLAVDYVAMLMEYGSDEFRVSFPSRPFFRDTFQYHKEHFALMLEQGINDIVGGKTTAKKVLQKIGKYAVTKVQDTIHNGKFPPIAENTAKRKESDSPLIDESILISSIKYRIERSE